jgi:hypothetical protein
MNGCPDQETLAAYVDRRLADTDGVEAHLAACAECRGHVVSLTSLLAQARPRRWPIAVAAAVAAAALLTIGLFLRDSTVETTSTPHVYLPPKPAPESPQSDPEPAPPKPDPNRVVLATLQDVQGQVWLMQGHQDKRKPGAVNDEILLDHGLFTHNGTAVLSYPDGTTVEIGGSAWIRRFSEKGGKRLEITEGTVRATVAKQPDGKPFVVVTPHGEARVVGTVFRLTAAKAGTRLEVEEGKVQLKGVDVSANQVAFAPPGGRPVVLPFSSLRGHWKLDDASGTMAADATGLGNDGRLKEKTEWTAGRLSGGIECRKGGFYVAPFQPGGSPYTSYTAAFWIHHEELDDWQDVYFSTPGFSIVREGNLERGRIRVMFRSDETSPNLAINAVVQPKQWIHLALVWDGQTARLHRNGQEVGSGRVTGVMAAPTSVNIGAEVDGKMDDVRFFRRALTPGEIATIMNGGEVR